MLAQTIQRQVTIGENVKFLRKDGHEISGRLVELSRDHITLECSGNPTTILIEMIGGWEVLQDIVPPESNVSATDPIIPVQETHPNCNSEQVSGSEDESNTPSDSNRQEALRITLEVESRFQAKLAASNLDPPSPDFDLSTEKLRGKHVSSTLDRVKSSYEYAVKVDELGAQFGRIQPLVSELEKLIANYPDSGVITRLLGYFYWLVGDVQKAFEMYSRAARASSSAKDWYCLAVLADKDAISCYAFKEVYSRTGVPKDSDAWYVFVNYVAKHRVYSSLADLKGHLENHVSEETGRILLEACLYLLIKSGNRDSATTLASRSTSGEEHKRLVDEAINILVDHGGSVSMDYTKAIESFTSLQSLAQEKKSSLQSPANVLKGHIYSYKTDRIFGFIRGADGKSYFFHRSAVSDEELLEQIRNFEDRIEVAFETTEGRKGPIAFNIVLPRTPEEMFNRAVEFAETGAYIQAIAQMRKVLSQYPTYPKAAELVDRWREYAQQEGVPRGANPYARALRAMSIEKDLDKASQLFHQAIEQGDNVDGAIKDLAVLQAQRGNPSESVKTLIKYGKRVSERHVVDNMLINFHHKAGQYDDAIRLLERKLSRASSQGQKVRVQMQIASCYLQKDEYSLSEKYYRNVIKLRPNMLSARRNLALCVSKRKDYDQAERLLKDIVENSRDLQAEELLQAIRQERAGQQSNIDKIIEDDLATTLSSQSREISNFAKFLLARCDFLGVPPDRVQRQEFNNGDVQRLVDFATKMGTQRPRERAEYYLSAAKILRTMEDDDPDQICMYLCRSFTSKADEAVLAGKLDSAKDLYVEALSVDAAFYAGSSGDDQDASNALVRFLWSTLGADQIPMQSPTPSIDETLEKVLFGHPDRSEVFEAIAYMISRSQFAANCILRLLYEKTSLQAIAIDYLKARSVEVKSPPKRLNHFVRLWNELKQKTMKEIDQISSGLDVMMTAELTTAALEYRIECIREMLPTLFLELDQERLRILENVFSTAHDLCGRVTFEEQHRLCNHIKNRCQDLIDAIESAPTKVSTEKLLPVVNSLKEKIDTRLHELYEQSTPELTLRLAVDSYIPNDNGEIEVQIEVSNRIGCSPADALELVILEQEEGFRLIRKEIKLDSSLSGADQRILLVPLRVDRETLNSQAFSLPVYAQYRNRSGETDKTQLKNFTVRLYSEADFEVIENPFAGYAAGGPVEDPSMFFGREDLITNVANSILSSRNQSKCVVIYGQFRTGKSSVLYHLKTRLQRDGLLLILDIGNIGAMLDPHSNYPLLYQILWAILQELQVAVEDRVDAGMPRMDLKFPSDLEFYQHPTPLVLFSHIFQTFHRAASNMTEWKETSVVLLVDEFSYLHELIEAGDLSGSFMKNWKALLQRNFFNAVLVGQDVMPKFKQRFPNEFGTTQDERVTYLSRDDAKRLIEEPVRLEKPYGDSKSRYRGKAIDRILELTAGSPFYIQIFCSRLVDYMNRECSILVTEADVDRVKNEMIEGENSLDPDKFDNLISSGDTSTDAISKDDALAVLEEIARHSNSSANSCSQDSISCKTASPIHHVLDDLERREVIRRQRTSYYAIQVGLFKEWLLAHQ